MEPLLQVENLSKSFPGVKALDHMRFDLFPGEVHILAGENGAGKSTLSKCILGYLKPDEGSILFDGEAVSFASPKDALKKGIAAVYQELTLVPWLSAAENIFFNREPVFKNTGILRRSRMNREAAKILSEVGGEDIDVTLPVRRLGIAGQQMVEIAKVLSMNPRVIIFDEPTAALSEKEAAALFVKIRKLKQQGVGMIYISHRMQEYEKIGDRITVMRDGKLVVCGKQSDFTEKELVRCMVGRDVEQVFVRSRRGCGEEVLKACQVSDRKGKVRGVSLTLHRGEIVGIAGLVGSGRTEFARLLFGIDRVSEGKILLHGEDVTGRNPGDLVEKGLGLLPEDRKGQGLFLRGPVTWNVTSASLKKLFSDHLIRSGKERKVAEEAIESLDIAVPDAGKAVFGMSGGNQQKAVMAKWLLADTDVILFDEPTRGIDVGSKMEIYQQMDRMAAEGKTILMISSELPELLGMCDRICVMREGRLVKEFSVEEFKAEDIGEFMLESPAQSADADVCGDQGGSL